MHNHLDSYKKFPRGTYRAPGKTFADVNGGDSLANGYICRILPFIEELDIAEQYKWDEGGTWNVVGPNNRLFARRTISTLRCPSDFGKASTVGGGVNYRGSAGPTWIYISDVADQIGMVNRTIDINEKDVTDGLSKTVMLGESVTPAQDGDDVQKRVQIWHSASLNSSTKFPNHNIASIRSACDAGMAGGSHLNRDSVFSTSLSSQGHNQFREEGSMWTVGSALSTIFNTILSPNSPHPNCMAHGSQNLAIWPSVVAATSRHPGVVQVAMADGSVLSVNDNIENAAWQALGGRNDGVFTAGF